ncbi:tetratricopeptide repeat protein [Granulicella sp. WH15]|uniref:winged helix-turn-helix domain-containing protein n=1 Tax=Granulicella sp. WH15 TaxID=2602070 RepID=UPI00136712E9|nr:winged helix-turn-helix domain-containing protein [Granulicella sp. WH15]QHN03580.1 tetratricopeptide repeat protein [Granulicella sp. WH15]
MGSAVIYEFNGFRLDPANRLLIRNGKEQPLPGRAFDVLLMLLQSPGDLLTKEELLTQVWKGSFVEESNLTVAISTLRRALDEDPHDRRYIHTVARRGYRFVADVQILANVREKIQRSTTANEEPAAPVLPPIEDATLEPPSAPRQELPTVSDASTLKIHRWRLPTIVAGFLLTALLIGFWLLLSRPKPIHSLAVLPLYVDNKAGETGASEDQVVLLAITDGLISRLDTELVVRPTSAVLRYSPSLETRTGFMDPLAAGHEQDVDAVLTGSVENSSEQMTLKLRLLRVRDGKTLWQESFAARPNHISQLEQDAGDATATVLHRFGAMASPKKLVQSTSNHNDAPAYQLYLRGRYFWNLRTVDGLSKSAEYFKRAIAIDPNYAPAYAGLADSYALAASLFVMPGKSANVEARSAALSAIQLDPTLAEPHTSLGLIYLYIDWNLPAAEREFERSIQLNPNYVMAHYWYALDLAALGRFPQAMYEIHLTEKLDPLSLTVGTHAATIEYLAKDYAGAKRDLQRVLELDPNFARARARLGMVELATGDNKAAIAELTKALELCGDDDPWIEGLLGYALARSGNPDGAKHMLDQLRRRSTAHYVPSNSPGLVLLGLGRRQEAIAAFSEAVQDHSTTMVVAKVDPTLDSLRGDPAFEALLTHIKH